MRPRIDVHADDLLAGFGERHCEWQPDIAEPDNSNHLIPPNRATC